MRLSCRSSQRKLPKIDDFTFKSLCNKLLRTPKWYTRALCYLEDRPLNVTIGYEHVNPRIENNEECHMKKMERSSPCPAMTRTHCGRKVPVRSQCYPP
jgi:hypothetical protein